MVHTLAMATRVAPAQVPVTVLLQVGQLLVQETLVVLVLAHATAQQQVELPVVPLILDVLVLVCADVINILIGQTCVILNFVHITI